MNRHVLHGLLIVLAFWVAAHATLVTRPTKTCGTTNFSSEVTAGCTTIKAAEVDADLNAIVGGLNDITTANIDPAGLGTAAYADGSVTGTKIASSSVTSGNLVVGATVHATATGTVSTGLSWGTAQTTLATTSTLATRGGPVLIVPTCTISMVTGTGDFITLYYYRDASLLFSFDVRLTVNNVTTAVTPPPFLDTAATAGNHTYTLKSNADAAGIGHTGSANAGSLLAMELS